MLFISSIICSTKYDLCTNDNNWIEELDAELFSLASCNKSENVIISSISMIDIMYASYTDIKNGLIYKECFNSNIGGFSSMKYVNMFYEIVNEKSNSESIMLSYNFSMYPLNNFTQVTTISNKIFENQEGLGLKFNLQWRDEFSKFSTTTKPFYTKNGKYNVQMMSTESYYMYGKAFNESASFIELPLKKDFYMLIILPDVGRSLEDVEENMSPYILELTKHRKKTHIDLEIPQFKFKFESTFLAKLNTEDALTDRFELQHLSTIIVNEYGLIESPSENDFSFFPLSFGNGHKFHANRPFHFKIIKRICNNTGNLVLFSGRVKNFDK